MKRASFTFLPSFETIFENGDFFLTMTCTVRHIFYIKIDLRLAVALVCAPFAVKNLDDNVVLQYLAVIGLMVMAAPWQYKSTGGSHSSNRR